MASKILGDQTRQPGLRRSNDALLLCPPNAGGSAAVAAVASAAHFHERQHARVHANDVDFAAPGVRIARQNAHTQGLQILANLLFGLHARALCGRGRCCVRPGRYLTAGLMPCGRAARTQALLLCLGGQLLRQLLHRRACVQICGVRAYNSGIVRVARRLRAHDAR